MKPYLKITCLLLLFAGAVSPLSAQTSITSPAKQFLFKNYTTQNGLVSNETYAIAQDKNGYIYIGSSRGLSRFDGKTFYHKAIPEIYNNSAYVRYLHTTPSGNIISTSFMQGVFVQQDDGQFNQYLQNGRVSIGTNIANYLKTCPDSSILVCESFQLFHLKDDSLSTIYRSKGIHGMFTAADVDKDNNIWFGGTIGLGILQLIDSVYEPLFLPEFEDWGIVDILFDKEGTLHVATNDGYFRIKWEQPYTWDENYSIEEPFPELEELFINSIYLDQEENIWINTSTYGCFKTKGNSIILHLTKENGLLSSNIQRMIQDREGNYWFVTDNGVSMIDYFDNYVLAIDGKLFDEARDFVADTYNRIWLSGLKNIWIFQDEKLIPINLKGTPIYMQGIYDLKIYDSQLWIVCRLGVYKMPITKTMPDLRKLEKVVHYSTKNIGDFDNLAKDGTELWAFSQNKIYKYMNNRFIPVKFNHSDSAYLKPSTMVRDKYGYYWCGNMNYGLYRGTISQPQKDMLSFDIDKVYKGVRSDTSFVTVWLRDMCFDKADNLWISALYTGAYKLTLDTGGVVSYKMFSTANGLTSNEIYRLKCDDEGKIWIATVKGYNILTFDESGNETIEYTGKKEGITGIGMDQMQINNKLLFLTSYGVFVYQNQFLDDKRNETPPKVLITNLLVNGISDPKISANTKKIRLTCEQNNITIEFAAIAFRNADDIEYQYKLEGADKDWSVLSDRGFVEYASLRSGKYTFKVRAVIGEITGEETTFAFRIFPAYYQTIWFYFLICCVIFVLLYAFFKYRMSQVIKMERMRTRIASDLHDEIGSTLSSISLLSEMTKNQDKEEILVKALSKIGENSRDVLNSMDDIIWSVNPQNDSISNLILRLREYAIPVCEAKNINFNMNVEEVIHSMKLEMNDRRNIYLIVKEAINNAVKHSRCENLTVTFVIHHYLEISIQDDGCGFDTTLPTSRNGLTSMERRAKHFGDGWNIISEKDKGTTITLKTKII
ncbi:MAG: histidine kinase [Lentimicrobiaceae bacterium]|nr:histidine kinase [Lentimicrobiaceae bacterium]